MSVDLVIRSDSGAVSIAILRDKVLTELHREKSSTDFSVGDLYLGKVRKVVPSLNAAFVDVGYEKDAFLHYLDLGPQYNSFNKYTKGVLTKRVNSGELAKFKFEPEIEKSGKINQVLSGGQNILVQIAKEPISTKGPRLTAELTLAGRYIVLVPFSTKISISSRIKDGKERTRLRHLMKSICPENFGVIIRTVAENKKVAQLDADLRGLVERWDKLHMNLRNSKPPKKILGELNMTSTVLRDLLNADFNNIFVADKDIFEDIQGYLGKIAPEKQNILKMFKGSKDIFEHFGVNRQIKASFGRHVSMPSGAYLIVEHTEAMHVIDVNSGSRRSGDKGQEHNAVETNLEAAKEIARLLRLRDMGGIIAVDFIDMYEAKNRRALTALIIEEMSTDKAKHNVLMPSKFGVVEITRQRVRPETDIDTSENCPSCNGTGEIKAPVLIIDELINNLEYIFNDLKKQKITLRVHPFVEAYLKKGLKSLIVTWQLKYKKRIPVFADETYQYMEFGFFDEKGIEIEL